VIYAYSYYKQAGAQLRGAWGPPPPLGDKKYLTGVHIIPKLANFLENLKKICPHSNFFKIYPYS